MVFKGPTGSARAPMFAAELVRNFDQSRQFATNQLMMGALDVLNQPYPRIAGEAGWSGSAFGCHGIQVFFEYLFN